MDQTSDGRPEEKSSKEKIRLCPHCGQPIRIKVTVGIAEIESASDEIGNLTWKAELNDRQIKIVEDAKASGLFEIFEVAVRQRISTQTPKNMEKFFVTFMQTVVLKIVPREILNHFIQMFNGAKIGFWCAQGICMLVADGCIRAIMPQEVIVGQNVAVLGEQKKRVFLPVDLGSFYERVRDQAHYLESGQWMPFSTLREGSRQVRESIFKEPR